MKGDGVWVMYIGLGACETVEAVEEVFSTVEAEVEDSGDDSMQPSNLSLIAI